MRASFVRHELQCCVHVAARQGVGRLAAVGTERVLHLISNRLCQNIFHVSDHMTVTGLTGGPGRCSR